MQKNKIKALFWDVLKAFRRLWIKRKFDVEERLDFYQILAANLNSSSADPIEYMMTLKERYRSRKDIRFYMVKEWTDLLGNGYDLADSLRNWISDDEYLILQTSKEKAGGSRLALDKCIFFLEGMKKVDASIKEIVIASTVYMGLSLTAFLAFVFLLIPEVTSRFSSEMTSTNSFLLRIDFLKSNLILLVFLVLSFGVFIYRSMNWKPSPFRKKYLDRIPPYSLFKRYKSSAFLVTLSSFIASGMTMHESLQAFKNHKSKWLRFYVENMIEKHDSGDFSTGEVLDTQDFFNREVMDRISDYVDAGNFESKIEQIGSELIRFIVKKTQKMADRISYLNKIFFISVIGWLATGLGGVIKQTTSNLNNF